MLRIAFLVAVVSLVVLTACSDGDEATSTATVSPPSDNDSSITPVTPVAKPGTVPQSARPVDQTTTLGRIVRRANEAPLAIMTRRLLNAACQDNTMVFETSEEMIYAVFETSEETTDAVAPCSRFWDRDTVEAFSGEEIAIVLEVTEARFRVLIETLAGAQAEFTVAGIWVE